MEGTQQDTCEESLEVRHQCQDRVAEGRYHSPSPDAEYGPDAIWYSLHEYSIREIGRMGDVLTVGSLLGAARQFLPVGMIASPASAQLVLAARRVF